MHKVPGIKWKRTKTGRICYDEKKNLFRRSDVLRIYRQIGERYYKVSPGRIDSIIRRLEAAIEAGATGLFGGGSFGGAGATRAFTAQDAVVQPRIILIIEEF